MEQLFNKNGITVKNNLRAIQEELLRGTGFVMGGEVSAFMQRESLHEKNIMIIVDRGKLAPIETKFAAGRVKEALELFQRALKNHDV